MTPHRFLLITTLAVASFAAAPPAFAHGHDGPPAATCAAPGGAHGCYATIQAAIDAAQPGDTVAVFPGRYTENLTIDKPLTLAGAGENAVVLIPAISSPNPCEGSSLCGGSASSLILVRASDVTVHDLTLDGDNPALTSGIVRDGADLDARNGIIEDYYANTPFQHLTVYRVTVRNIYLRGIYASATGGTFDFHDNRVDNVQGDYYSIAMFAFAASGVFRHNIVSRANDAISANWSEGIQFLDNVITRSASGIHTDNAGGPGDVVRGNRIAHGTPGSYGIFVFVPYTAVSVTRNTVEGVDVGLSAFGQAAPVSTTFADNVVRGRRAPGSVGLFLTTDQLGYGSASVSATLQHNVISRFERGVVLESDPGNTLTLGATCNAIEGSSQAAVVAGGLAPEATIPGDPPAGSGTQAVTFSQNDIRGGAVAVDNRGADPVSAANNWWGCPGGPGAPGCGTLAGGVASTPWLAQPSACVPPSGRARRDDHDRH
ncbi:MAG: right-handed parallel beta-helix repeat-containing protein [Acidobacteriota bacterium]|nr:right-handed parallel beta-helix repeat-containing protein [Acidobacteriota bacterium]